MRKVQIKETGEVIDLYSSYIVVKNGYLFNNNTQKEEAVKGDEIISEGKHYIVSSGYTDFQIIPVASSEENSSEKAVVLSASVARNKQIIHNFTVEDITDVDYYIQGLMDNSLNLIEYIIKIIEHKGLQNSQLVLDFLDKLNKLSVKY